jgi:UDP-2-acetamido-3-amino-2,3-dideoxy-glucuronate N-acetyltransferase
MNYFKHETAIVDDGAKIGEGSKIWHWVHVSSGAEVGEKCILGQNVFVGSKAKVGNKVKIQNNVSIYDNVVIEDEVFCGPSMVFTNVNTPRAFIERKDEYAHTIVKRGASLGANCTIICGVTIGEYAFIGAGAVVTKNVKPHALMVGVPAVQVGWVSRAGEVLDDTMICPREGRKYIQTAEGMLEEIMAK